MGTSLAANPHGAHADPFGLAIAIGTGAWYAVYLTIGTRLVRAVDSLAAGGYVCLGASASFLFVSLIGSGLRMPSTPSSLMLLAGIAVIATAVPIVSLFAGMRRLGTPRAALLSTLEPIVTVALGAAILHERLSGGELLGGVLIVTALILLQLPSVQNF